MNKRESFPLVGDDEEVIVPSRTMDLYDDGDLISNINGRYEDRQFVSESQPQMEIPKQPVHRTRHYRGLNPDSGRKLETSRELSPGQLAREEAREDLKRKRSAPYLSQDRPFKSKVLPKPQPNKRDKDRAQLSNLTAAADRLRQENYILAEPIPNIQSPELSSVEVKKKPYDFLKNSQVYNYQENRKLKEKNAARELNVTRFEQRDN